MEVFGEEPFEPENRTECMTLDDKQRALSVKYDRESSEIVNNYIKGDFTLAFSKSSEVSFSILIETKSLSF